MVSAIHQCHSATGIYTFPPLEPPSQILAHPTPLGCRSTGFGLPVSYGKVLLAVYPTCGDARISMRLSQNVSPLLLLK